MATQNFSATVNQPLPHELAGKSAETLYKVYEDALELSSLLDAFNASSDAPQWVWPLARMARRFLDAADVAHVEAIRLRDSLSLHREAA